MKTFSSEKMSLKILKISKIPSKTKIIKGKNISFDKI